MRIMVVDDERDIKPLFEQQFRRELRAGLIEFKFVFSGEDALNCLKEFGTQEIVLILSDINMPGMNGLILLKLLKENYPHLKVFMVTAYGDEKNYQAAKEFGADNFLTKPIDFAQLKKLMEEARNHH
jgi:DNA-binding NtrC family response regulator